MPAPPGTSGKAYHPRPGVGNRGIVASDAAGRIVVPRTFVDAFLPRGSGGLFTHQSTARRVQRRIVDGPAGPVHVTVSEARGFDAWRP